MSRRIVRRDLVSWVLFRRLGQLLQSLPLRARVVCRGGGLGRTGGRLENGGLFGSREIGEVVRRSWGLVIVRRCPGLVISCGMLGWKMIIRTNDRLYESKDSREILNGSLFSLGVPLCVVEYEVDVDDRLKKLRSFGGGDGYRMSAELQN
jgi:hypothetical protein